MRRKRENWGLTSAGFPSVTIRHRDLCLGAFERANNRLKWNGLEFWRLFLVSYILNHEIYIYRFLVFSGIFSIQELISFDLIKKIKIWVQLLLEGINFFYMHLSTNLCVKYWRSRYLRHIKKLQISVEAIFYYNIK